MLRSFNAFSKDDFIEYTPQEPLRFVVLSFLRSKDIVTTCKHVYSDYNSKVQRFWLVNVLSVLMASTSPPIGINNREKNASESDICVSSVRFGLVWFGFD